MLWNGLRLMTTDTKPQVWMKSEESVPFSLSVSISTISHHATARKYPPGDWVRAVVGTWRSSDDWVHAVTEQVSNWSRLFIPPGDWVRIVAGSVRLIRSHSKRKILTPPNIYLVLDISGCSFELFQLVQCSLSQASIVLSWTFLPLCRHTI